MAARAKVWRDEGPQQHPRRPRRAHICIRRRSRWSVVSPMRQMARAAGQLTRSVWPAIGSEKRQCGIGGSGRREHRHDRVRRDGRRVRDAAGLMASQTVVVDHCPFDERIGARTSGRRTLCRIIDRGQQRRWPHQSALNRVCVAMHNMARGTRSALQIGGRERGGTMHRLQDGAHVRVTSRTELGRAGVAAEYVIGTDMWVVAGAAADALGAGLRVADGRQLGCGTRRIRGARMQHRMGAVRPPVSRHRRGTRCTWRPGGGRRARLSRSA